MLSATPLYGTFHSWMSNERFHTCAINEDRKLAVSDGEPQKSGLELTDASHITHSMVDASAACRMNPLAALGMERGGLMREGLHMHGGMVYPGIRALSADKAREGAALPLGYVSDRLPDLHYKPDVSLESRKPSNGYVGLYKSPPPGLQKPVLVPPSGGDTLGLDRRVGPADKPSELGLNGSSSYLHLPWVSPYGDAGMYPYLEPSKYPTLSMGSFISQPSPYLSQHLAYQSLCGAGGSAAGSERLFYMPPYSSAPISSPLAPPMRIPTATVAPAALSPLVHCQENSLQSLGPRIHHEPSAFGQQLHQQPPQTHHPSHSGKAARASGKSTAGSGHSVDSVPSPITITRPQTSIPPPPPLMESTMDFQKPLPPGPPASSSSSLSSSSSSPSTPHPYYITNMASEHSSPARSMGHKSKAKEGGAEHRPSGGERKPSRSPSKLAEKHLQQAPTKDPADKPLDLSAKMDFGATPNGFPPKLEPFAKLGHTPSSCYGLPPSRELLKETLPSSPSSSAGTPSKPSERPEIISTLHSSWVVPGPAPALVPIPAPALHPDSNQSKASSVIKNKNLERVTPQQRSSSCPRIGEPNAGPAPLPAPAVPTSTSRPASASPSPNINADWPRPEKGPTPVHTGSQLSSGKVVKVSKKAETQEVVYKPQPPHLENGHAPSRLYLSQSEAFLPPSLAYNRYLPYSVPDSLSLPHIPLPGKGPVYPHPVLLSSSTLYPPRLTPKPSLPYGIPSGHGDFLTYDSREMVHPLMSPHLTLDPKSGERPERRSIPQAKPPQGENMPHRGRHAAQTGDVAYRETGISVAHDAKRSNKPLAAGKEKMVCIDLVQADVDGGAQITKHIIPCTRKGDPSRPNGSEPELMQLLLSGQTGGVGFAAQKPAETERQPEICGGLRLVEPPRPSAACQRYGSPEPSPGEESPSGLSPLPDLAEQQTLRCARTSGDRTADEADSRLERHGLPHYTDLGAGGPESLGSHMDNIDIDGGNGSSRNRRSSLAKRIANSSGYVGDRFKCVTNELYTDSSKLSREQRALQRAMLRFSELELKERGSGGLAGRELAEGQAGEGIAEDSQQKDGVRLTCGSNRVPVLKRCTPQGETTPFQEWDGNVGATPSPLLVRDASRGLAPVGKRPHAEEEEEGGDEEVEQLASLAKRPRLIMDDWPLGAQCRPPEPVSADAGNLKVCIELRGLRLSRPPHLQCLLEFWERLEVGADTALAPREPAFPPASAFGRQEANPTDRKVRGCSLDERLAKKRSEVNRSWCDATLRDPDAEQASPRTYVQAGRLDSCSPDDSSSGTQDRRHRACDGEAEKPKGKRQCKTKHLSLQERRRASGGIEDCPQLELEPAPENEVAFRPSAAKQPTSPPYYDDPPAKVCPPSPCPAAPPTALQSLPSQPSPLPAGNPPPETPASRPMPPEARRLIVNKNAGETLLQRAARLGYEEVVLYCLENKVCDVNHRDNAGYCALHEACARGWLSIVQHLIEYGADINCSAQDGTRPLHDAVENDHLEVVRLLLSYGADPTLATYSGRSLLKMTHSDLMENFLLDYFADLQGHDDDDPGLRWDFYGSSVCEPAKDSAAFDILADPPGPGDDEEDLQQRGVFEFEFSDRPLLPCYNIQVSLSQGPRNWLLLSDVLKRLKMSARAFRTAFAHIEVATIAEAEFYKQASLSQLFSSPEELEGFLPNSKELLDLVEISGELATLLGSSVECLDSRWEPVGVATS